MNDIKLSDCSTGILDKDITFLPVYRPVLLFLHELRSSLCKNEKLRHPFLKLLLSLHSKTSSNAHNARKINTIRPKLPSDEDVVSFFSHHWPEVRFSSPIRDDKSYIWGSTNTGSKGAKENIIYIGYPLVSRWLKVVSNALLYNITSPHSCYTD